MTDAAIAGFEPRKGLNRIDFSDPRLRPMISMLQNTIRRDTSAWQPAAGVSVRRIRISDGTDRLFSCFILEPDHPSEHAGACLFCHGGGMIFPLQTSSLRIAEIYVREARIAVWVPDYHLPPEAPFPIPLRECLRAWQEMTPTAGQCILYGESVGGALAASLAQHLRDNGHPAPVLQMLIEPALDCDTASYPSAALDSRAAWTLKNDRFMWEQYLGDGHAASDPLAVPMRGRPENLPPAYIETAELDILRDEGGEYARRLRAAGVNAEHRRIMGVRHGFDTETDHPFVHRVLLHRAGRIKQALSETIKGGRCGNDSGAADQPGQ